MTATAPWTSKKPTAVLVLADGTVIEGIGIGATGKVTVNAETIFTKAGESRFVCPTANGGKGFQAGADGLRTESDLWG